MPGRLPPVLALAALVAFAPAAPLFAQHRRTRGRAAAAPTDATRPLLAALHAAAQCPSETAPFRFWCIAADGYATGTAAPLPPEDVTLLGFTIELAEGHPAEAALRDQLTLAALALRHGEGGVTGKIQSITPSDPDESRQMAQATFNLAAVFKGRSATAEIDRGLAGYLASLPARAAYPVRRGPQGWLLTGASSAELRRVGDYWVAVEVPASGRGIFLSMFTERFGPQR